VVDQGNSMPLDKDNSQLIKEPSSSPTRSQFFNYQLIRAGSCVFIRTLGHQRQHLLKFITVSGFSKDYQLNHQFCELN
jgi:hypothetical protein